MIRLLVSLYGLSILMPMVLQQTFAASSGRLLNINSRLLNINSSEFGPIKYIMQLKYQKQLYFQAYFLHTVMGNF